MFNHFRKKKDKDEPLYHFYIPAIPDIQVYKVITGNKTVVYGYVNGVKAVGTGNTQQEAIQMMYNSVNTTFHINFLMKKTVYN